MNSHGRLREPRLRGGRCPVLGLHLRGLGGGLVGDERQVHAADRVRPRVDLHGVAARVEHRVGLTDGVPGAEGVVGGVHRLDLDLAVRIELGLVVAALGLDGDLLVLGAGDALQRGVQVDLVADVVDLAVARLEDELVHRLGVHHLVALGADQHLGGLVVATRDDARGELHVAAAELVGQVDLEVGAVEEPDPGAVAGHVGGHEHGPVLRVADVPGGLVVGPGDEDLGERVRVLGVELGVLDEQVADHGAVGVAEGDHVVGAVRGAVDGELQLVLQRHLAVDGGQLEVAVDDLAVLDAEDAGALEAAGLEGGHEDVGGAHEGTQGAHLDCSTWNPVSVRRYTSELNPERLVFHQRDAPHRLSAEPRRRPGFKRFSYELLLLTVSHYGRLG